MQRRNLLKTLGLVAGGLSVSASVHSAPYLPKRVLRIAHLTDIHIQPHLWAGRSFEKCLHHLQNLDIKPDFILNTGDSVMGSHSISKEKSAKEWQLYHKVMVSENSLPLISCIGNHDIWHPSNLEGTFQDGKKRAMDETEITRPYQSFDRNGWHFIMLDSVQPRPEGAGYLASLDEAQMGWLKEDLKNTPPHMPVMVASHIPILSASVFFDGDNLKEGNWVVPGSWMHMDAAQIIKLFNRHENVKLAVSGHIHLLDRVEYNKVTYCCNGAVCGNYWMGKYKETTPGYAIIDLFNDGSFSNEYVKYH
ncbi:metallophosphoesterase family protein [Dyadobacter arcticus]|uniref:3',5'-cyclic AMP phosphodiesterase CpdA n=1 Tax=Dyadobacter arcticus TaxID=1078754 RepID=A0ABX0UHL8_9BACT|nr:metallophosphoesterase [Dyadobacter arcticus]NIJ52451.1 3',5'-cyclic AMP phosphodiesterase CpdA [Dyadobacter arcticus]